MPEPITASSPRPLFLADGRHWHDHGLAVYHLHRSGDLDLSTRMDVYSQLRDASGHPMVTLHAQAGAAVFPMRMLPAQAEALAAMLRAAAQEDTAGTTGGTVHATDEGGVLDLRTSVTIDQDHTRSGARLVGVMLRTGGAICPLRTDLAEARRLADMLDRAAATCVRVAEALEKRRALDAAAPRRRA